jgi:hypothetical protein
MSVFEIQEPILKDSGLGYNGKSKSQPRPSRQAKRQWQNREDMEKQNLKQPNGAIAILKNRFFKMAMLLSCSNYLTV